MSDVTGFSASVATEAHPPSPREQVLQQVLQQADARTVPSGILHRVAPARSVLLYADGGDDAPALGQEEWEQALAELDHGRLIAGAALGDQVQAIAAACHARGEVPVFIAALDYQTVRGRVWSAIERQQQDGAAELPFAAPEQLFETRRAFLASALLPQEFSAFVAQPPVHYGPEVTYVFPSQGLLGDASRYAALQVDFGDGQGLRAVACDQPVAVRYPQLGGWTISLQLSDAGGVRRAAFRINLVEDPLLQLQCQPMVREERAPVTATIRRPGIPVARAQAYVIRHRDRPRITRPLLMVEGFPGNYPWPVIARYASQSDFLCKLFNHGHDIVLVRFPDGPQRLEANAYALIALIQSVIAEREGNHPLIVGGFSMGGLIARYALAYMEHERRSDPTRPHHQTSRFFTVDTPHEGANLAVAVQALAQGVRGDEREAKLMATPAAQQLLLTWINPLPWHDGQQFGPSPLRLEFLRELERVGSMPRELEDTIAIANGAGDGRQHSVPGALAMKYACTLWFYADCYTQPRNTAGMTVVQFRNGGPTYRFHSTEGSRGVDSAPGGLPEEAIYRRVHDAVPRGVVKELKIENACFIPTTSALAISGSNYFQTPDLGQSKFRSVTYSHEGNLPHIALTPTLVEFLVKFITRPRQTDAVGNVVAPISQTA